MLTLPENPNVKINYTGARLKTIYLAGGCFWGTQAFIKRVRGVSKTLCGYANGKTIAPTYEQVCHAHTGHAEAVLVEYSPDILPLAALLDAFFETINPTLKNRQGGDIGKQYRSGIYYIDAAELSEISSAAARQQAKYTAPVVTEIMPLQNFYPAEECHQDYLEKNPGGYCHVDFGRLPK